MGKTVTARYEITVRAPGSIYLYSVHRHLGTDRTWFGLGPLRDLWHWVGPCDTMEEAMAGIREDFEGVCEEAQREVRREAAKATTTVTLSATVTADTITTTTETITT